MLADFDLGFREKNDRFKILLLYFNARSGAQIKDLKVSFPVESSDFGHILAYENVHFFLLEITKRRAGNDCG